MKKQLISALIPAYNEEECIYELYKRVSSVLSKLDNYDYEILMINDGSKDKTLEIMQELLSLGVIGEYLGRIFDEVKNRPLYFVEKYSGDEKENENI